MPLWYFETSAVNYIADNFRQSIWWGTKVQQERHGRQWKLSPVTLVELLMTSDDGRRNHLLECARRFLHRDLLPSPGDMIVSYIENGIPIHIPSLSLTNKRSIGATWQAFADDFDISLSFDHDDIKMKASIVQTQTRLLHKAIRGEDNLQKSPHPHIDLPSDEIVLDYSLHQLVQELPFVRGRAFHSEQELRAYRVTLFFIVHVLCAELDFDNSALKEFWSQLAIEETSDRVSYVIRNLPELVLRGPFVMMAMMALSQMDGKYPRGLWLDCMHCVYFPHAQYFMSCDRHFQRFRHTLSRRGFPAESLKQIDTLEWGEVVL